MMRLGKLRYCGTMVEEAISVHDVSGLRLPTLANPVTLFIFIVFAKIPLPGQVTHSKNRDTVNQVFGKSVN